MPMASGKVFKPGLERGQAERQLKEQRHGEQHPEKRHHREDQHQAGGTEEPVAEQSELHQRRIGAQLPPLSWPRSSPPPPRMAASMSGVPQPRVGASLIPNINRAKPNPASTKPGRSNRPADGSRCSSRKISPNRKARIPRGRLTKKTQRHERSVTSRPPSTGPTAGATATWNSEDARGPHPFGRRKGPEQQGHPHRGQHAPADPLEHPVEHQLGEPSWPCRRAGRRW